ncbi:malonyl-ACP O-methyltransferase BioC [Thiohalocapsa sp. ML1]|jgi:malonyl-CoA O-methyltransferase|uniref:malonyl-ACP O-methyltransferase BioC n=1 Tax=Thiohalocapsa sp. ML1 TaxID=1431688 RepID=UPI0007320595|nr:malonyl-ACP O-methyltransferase BioC [Thiohalocapsa sp. ML1]
MNQVIDHAIGKPIIDKPIDKAAARRAFDAAANGYEAVAVLQREIGNRMLERLGYIRLAPKRVLDLGCGPGFTLDGLARRYRGAEILALDFALSMLRRARRRGHWLNRPRLICADAEALPLADDSVDLVFSNATLQWVNDLDATFRELLRVLRPGGLLLFSTFGPDTLRELRTAWAAVDQGAHVSPFLDMHDIGDALVRARFADPVMDVERMTLTYADLRGLMRDLKQLGAHNALTGRARGLTGRRRLAALEQAYESQRQGGRLPATYEVVHGHAWVTAKAQPQLATADGIAIPLEAVAGRLRRRSAAGGEP